MWQFNFNYLFKKLPTYKLVYISVYVYTNKYTSGNLIFISFQKISNLQVCVCLHKHSHPFPHLKSSLLQEEASGAPGCPQQVGPVLPGAPQSC